MSSDGNPVVTAYLPFRGLSAWFSSSVRPCMAKKWDEFGGCFLTEDKADFLFSDNSYSVDTVRIYDTQRSVTVFQSAWLNEVVRKRCTVHDVPLGQYLVLPHYLVQVCMSGDPFKTPEPAALMEVHRERGNRERGGEATNRSLSQLLAEREKRKESQLSCSTGKNTALKNSREFHGSQSGGDTEREGAGGGGGEVGKNSERGEGVRDMLALWDRLLELSQTTCLKEIQHVDTFELLDQKLMDFDPSLSHFTMRRKI